MSEDALADFSMSSEEVVSHAFFPLLGYQKKERRIDFDEDDHLIIKVKPRDIRYAAHLDAAIYGLYAQDLSAIYDDFLTSNGMGEVVLAYRGDIGSNIDFAYDFFQEIRDRGDCYVVCLDISKFFDNLRHDLLKARLSEMLAVERLPADWFSIFRRLTRYEYVMGEDLEATLGRVHPPRICDIETFRKNVRPLIRTHPDPHGVPQGTPLSGLLANVYMAHFDLAVRSLMVAVGGSYRRYSDDIALVFPSLEASAGPLPP